MAVKVRRCRRIESWSDWKAAGGTRQYVVDKLLSAKSTTSLFNDRLTLVLALDNPALEYLLTRTIIRIDESDSVYDEWKIIDRASDEAAGLCTISATSIRSTELSTAALIEREDSDGVVVFDFESLGLTPQQHIETWVLPALADAGFLWIDIGTIEPTLPIDVTYQWDTPLSALLHIASLTECELDIRRDGDTGYLIDLISKVNETAQRADLRIDKNAVNITADEDTIDQTTRVYPRGSTSEETAATMARALWKVSGVAGSVVSLVDPAGGAGPLLVDDQLNNLYLRKPDGTLTAISDSDATAQSVTVASATGIATDDLIQFRRNSTGKDLTFLDDVLAVTDYDVISSIKDVPGVPATNNLVKNPFMRDWSAGMPVGWSAVGSPTITQQTVAPYVENGGSSAKITDAADGEGIVSDAVPIEVSNEHPFVSGYANLWVVSGSVRVELLFTTPDGEKVVPVGPVASNSILGQWEKLGVSGIDANEIEATEVAIRIVQNGETDAEFYVDAGQVTESPSQQPLLEGSGGTILWQAANEVLRTSSLPKVQYAVPLVDLEQLDATKWSESALIIGAPARVRSPKLDVDILTRLLEINRDYLDPKGTSVLLSNKFDDLTDFLSASHRRGRRTPTPTEPNPTGTNLDITVPPLISFQVRTDYDPDGTAHSWLTVTVQGGPGTYTTRAIARSDREPTEAELDATTPSTAGVRTGVFEDLLELPTGKRFYIAARGYNSASEGTAIARESQVWLGRDTTPGADIRFGTIVAQADKIIYGIAFDESCSRCEVWTREYTENTPLVSVEGLTPAPFKVLMLGEDAMVPGIESPVSLPLSAPENYQLTAWIPIDHLNKRGNPKFLKVRGSQGVLGGGGGGDDPGQIFGAALAFWWDPTQETSYNDDDQLTTVSDFGLRGNDGTAHNSNQDFYATYGDATWSENEQNGWPMFIFNADASSTNILRQWLISPDLGFVPSAGSFLMIVAKRHVIHRQFNVLAMFANNADSFAGTSGTSARLQETDGAEGAGTQDEMKWTSNASSQAVIYGGSLTTVIATYGILFLSPTSALLYVDGVPDPNGPFDPSNDADTKEALRVGEGNYKVGDVVYVEGIPTSQQIVDAFAFTDEKWVTGPGPGGGYTPGDEPDPPTAVVQIGETGETVTVLVTLPATAPDYIRVTIGSRTFDVAVTEAGGADQEILIEGLTPSHSYLTFFQSVENDLVSDALGYIVSTNGTGGVLDAPTGLAADYSRGDQAVVVTLTSGANNPRGTQFVATRSENAFGPFTGSNVGYDDGSGATIIVPYAQRASAFTLYLRVFARKADWTDSTYVETSIVIPATPLPPGVQPPA